MSVALVVGTPKGAAILKSKDRLTWSHDFVLRGWPVTASVRDDQGRTYIAVNSPNFGVALFASDDLENWKQLDAAPRYRPGDRGNAEHHRLIAKEDFGGLLKGGGRFVDQIWTLHAAHGALWAGVSEAGLFVSRDRGASWQPIDGFNEHPSRDSWTPGFGGLGAHTVLSDSGNPDRMWVGVSAAGLFRTDDGGRTWSPKNKGVNPAVESEPASTGQCVHSVTHDPKNSNVMFRQEHRGMHRSDDGGDSWTVIENGLPVTELSDGHHCSFGFPSVMDLKSGRVFIVPLDGDNFRFPRDGQLAVYSTKDGARWEPLTNGLPRNCFTAVLRKSLAADQLDPCCVYVGTASGTVYGSTDLGGAWHEIASGLPRILSVDAYVQ
ncbi:MAG TPA: hypothetical protein VGU69_12865 [Rhizomicrobium sp.]|nr:hypothetical protein [Rhizomicrobium sp.]